MTDRADTVLIVADGEVDPSLLALEAGRAGCIIAADGGANHLAAAKILPDVVLGDFDSVDPEVLKDMRAGPVKVVEHPEDKDFTDSELALEYALSLGPRRVHLVGALGGRPDHELANLQLLARGIGSPAEIAALAPGLRVFAIAGSATLRGVPGDILSLLPLSEKVSGITLTGLKYPLEDGSFEVGRPLGMSNVFVEDTATVRVEEGRLLAFHFSKEGMLWRASPT